MMSPEQIRAMARQAAAKAAREGMVPFLVEAEDIADFREGAGFPFPFLGSYVPKGWKKVQEYFVDSSGFGAPGEPALTVSEFIGRLVVGRGYAITEAGQFQVYVGEYIPTPTNGHRKRRSKPMPAALADQLAHLLPEALVADFQQYPNGANHELPTGS